MSVSQAQVREMVGDRCLDVIKFKRSRDRPVIDQAIAGMDLFERDSDPGIVEPVVV